MPAPAFPTRLLAALIAAGLPSAPAHAETPAPLMTVLVEGTPAVLGPIDATQTTEGLPDDVAARLTRVPGAAVVRNGAQTGIVQLRGLFNERVRVRVDGMTITPACPNHMDPPLHYAGPEALDTLEVIVGATPVSLGGDSIAGSVEAKSRPPVFAVDTAWKPLARIELGASSGNDGLQAGVELGAANDMLNLRYLGGYQDADNYESARGEVADTGYTSERHALAAAYRHGSGTWEFEAGTHRARDVGTPTLPMDMVVDDADRVRLAFKGDTPIGRLEAGVYRHAIDHVMDNYSLRPLAGPARMIAPSTSDDTGFTLALARAAGSGTLRLGFETHLNDFDVYQQNVTNPMLPRQDMFRDAERNRTGVYGEWEGALTEGLRMNAGLRGEVVRMDAGDIVDVFAPAAADRDAFNARDHARRDANLDATLALRYALGPRLDLEGALTRKTRSPSILERYLYTPTGASAGQADGRTYWGNLDLEPEVAHGVDLGVSVRGRALRAKASVFWQDVHDFIQGQPAARLDTSGLPVLQYANVHARLWGAELSVAQRFGALELGAWASFTRGRNTDTDDNLYRIAPLRGGLSADYRKPGWRVGGEWLLSARKVDVAAYNGEPVTPGYGLLNLHAAYAPLKNLTLTAGIDNVFDKLYYDPLAGVNRVAGGAAAVGGAMPAVGRSAYVKMNWTY
ncbi:MAG: TonB-dependent receptor [Pseudomonadota bacterium]